MEKVKMDQISECSLCQDPETSENPIIACSECNLKVHILCYGIELVDENWKCSPCTAGASEPVCKLCVQSGGALKKRLVAGGRMYCVAFSLKDANL